MYPFCSCSSLNLKSDHWFTKSISGIHYLALIPSALRRLNRGGISLLFTLLLLDRGICTTQKWVLWREKRPLCWGRLVPQLLGTAEVGWENSSGKESPEGLISFKRDLRNMGSLAHGSRSAQLAWPWQCPLLVSRVVAGQNEPRELTASFFFLLFSNASPQRPCKR